MKVQYRDQSVSIITEEQGNKLSDLLMSGDCPEYLDIDGVIVRKDFIVKLEPGGYSEADVVKDRERLLDRPDYRGRPSEAKERLRQRFERPV